MCAPLPLCPGPRATRVSSPTQLLVEARLGTVGVFRSFALCPICKKTLPVRTSYHGRGGCPLHEREARSTSDNREKGAVKTRSPVQLSRCCAWLESAGRTWEGEKNRRRSARRPGHSTLDHVRTSCDQYTRTSHISVRTSRANSMELK